MKLIARPETISLAIAANVTTTCPPGWTKGAYGRPGFPNNTEEWNAHNRKCYNTLKTLLKKQFEKKENNDG